MFETDKTLCMKFVRGNKGAFNTLASKWQNHILNFAYQYLGDEENARDVVQEVLSRLYLQAAQNLFLKIKPKRLIVVFDTRNLETSLSLVAKKNNVRSIMVSPNVLMDLAEINNYDTTDLVALPGKFIRDKLINQGK